MIDKDRILFIIKDTMTFTIRLDGKIVFSSNLYVVKELLKNIRK